MHIIRRDSKTSSKSDAEIGRSGLMQTCRQQMGKGKPASAAGRDELPAASVDAVVSPDPDLCSERAGRLLLDQFIQRARCAAQALQGQEAVRQETQGRMMVEARPGASL